MFRKTTCVLASEAIDYQERPVTHEMLIPIIQEMLNSGEKANHTKSLKRMQEIIFSEHGLQAVLSIESVPNLMVFPPDIKKNHALLNSTPRLFASSKDSLRALANKQVINGTIDLANAKFGGVFSELPFKIYIGSNWFFNGKLTAAEISAGLIHELGHVGGLFEMISYNFRLNVLIDAATNEFLGTKDKNQRFKLIRQIEGITGGTIDDHKSLADIEDGDKFKVVVLAATFASARSTYGCLPYDLEIFERVADQFAVRSGCAEDLTKALIKYDKSSGGYGTMSTAKYLMIESVKLTGFLLLTVKVSPFALALLIGNPTLSDYPSLKDRIDAIRLECVGATKSRSVSKEMQARFLKDIEVIDDLTKDIHKRDTLYAFIWRHMTPWGRRDASTRGVLQQLESLTNNDLYVASTKFRHL